MTAKDAIDDSPRFIWATRGRAWGFRFLRTGGLPDPLHEYEKAFRQLADEPAGWQRVRREEVALRFPDPENRLDIAGRVIPHDFVLLGPWSDGVVSLGTGIQAVWPLVADEFARVWGSPHPPPPNS